MEGDRVRWPDRSSKPRCPSQWGTEGSTPSLLRHPFRSGRRAGTESILAAQIVAEQPDAVLRVVAVDAEVLPVAPVRRVVGVVAVAVMDGEEMEVGAIELARAARADPAVQRERALA